MLCLLERPSQPAGPVNFNIVCKDATSLTLSWNAPASTNGEIDYYVVSVFYFYAWHGDSYNTT